MALTKALQKRIDLANKYIKFAQKHDIFGRGYFGSTVESVIKYPSLITVSPKGRSAKMTIVDAYGGGKPTESFNLADPDQVSDLRYSITHYVIGAIKRGAKDEGRSIPKTLSNPTKRRNPHHPYPKKSFQIDRVSDLTKLAKETGGKFQLDPNSGYFSGGENIYFWDSHGRNWYFKADEFDSKARSRLASAIEGLTYTEYKHSRGRFHADARMARMLGLSDDTYRDIFRDNSKPRKRRNSDKGEKYAQLFRDLRDKRISTIQLDMKGVMGGGTDGFRTFKRGRMGKPKRWRGGWNKPAFERVSLSVVPLDDMGNPKRS